MQIDIEKQNGACILHLSGDLVFGHAREFKRTLADALRGCRDVEINLSQVSDVDTAGLQVLIAAKREARARNKKLALVEHSQVIADVLETVHLVGFFGDPLVLSG